MATPPRFLTHTIEPILSISCLSKSFSDGGLPVVNGLSFDVEEGELFALLGPSGCGKTTTLRMLAGFMRPDKGSINLQGNVLASESSFVPPEKRGIGFVFQDYALFPHLTVAQNIAFGIRHLTTEKRKQRTSAAISVVGLDGLDDRLPHALSGGQQQRVALARALAPKPRLLLLDEPFSNLDAYFRNEMRDRVREILKNENITTVLVTHDQEEALLFAERVAVMQSGRIDQIGTPEEIYLTPRTLFVAQFLGQTNLVLTNASGKTSDSVLGPLTLHREADGPVLVAIRPEHFSISSAKLHEDDLEATVLERSFKGHDITYRVQVGPVDCLVHTHNREPFAPGDLVFVRALEPAVVLDKAGG